LTVLLAPTRGVGFVGPDPPTQCSTVFIAENFCCQILKSDGSAAFEFKLVLTSAPELCQSRVSFKGKGPTQFKPPEEALSINDTVE